MFERFKEVYVEIHDANFLQTIPVSCIRKYLKHHHWTVHQEIIMQGECKGWIYEKEYNFVVVPKNERFADYPLRLAELLKRVSGIEGGNQLSIVEEMFLFLDKEGE